MRGVQVHGSAREEADAGERTALQLTGPGLEELERGMQLTAADAFATTTSLVGSFTLLRDAPKAIKGSTPVRFHLLSSEIHGRLRPLAGPLEPGKSGPVEIRLAAPIVAVRGDRFIARRPSPPITLGGGQILDPQWHRRRGKELEGALKALESGGDATLLPLGQRGR